MKRGSHTHTNITSKKQFSRLPTFHPSYLSVSLLFCLLEGNFGLNGFLLYSVSPPLFTTRKYTLPQRGPLNQALHMPDLHLFFPLLSTTPFSFPLRLLTLWLLLCCCCHRRCPMLPSAPRQEGLKECVKRRRLEGEKRWQGQVWKERQIKR